MIKVLFVCLGNICRSPMAEGLFKAKIIEHNLTEEIYVGSAATGDWNEGKPPHKSTQEILNNLEISTDSMIATRITSQDFEDYDYIFGMDHNNIRDLKSLLPTDQYDHKIHLFLGPLNHSKYDEVPDPYYTGNFKLTQELIDSGCEFWLNDIIQRHQLNSKKDLNS